MRKALRYRRYAFLVLVAIALVVLALANRGVVTVTLLPADLAAWTGLTQSVELPLFLVILGAVIVGLLVGFVWEWLREHRHRADAGRQRRENHKLEREVQSLKGRQNEGKDEVLALLEDTEPAR